MTPAQGGFPGLGHRAQTEKAAALVRDGLMYREDRAAVTARFWLFQRTAKQ